MRLRRIGAFALALLIGSTVGMVAADQGFVESTSAAWTDRAAVAAPVTAGTWQTTKPNTCIAYAENGRVMPGCTVDSITFDGWGEPGKQSRNYYVNFINVDPYLTHRVSFDVDLTTAKGAGTSWSWKHASVRADGGQFTPRDGWTCAELPQARGMGKAWERLKIWFVVDESPTGAPTMCS